MSLKSDEEKIYKVIELIESGKAAKDILHNLQEKQVKKLKQIGRQAVDDYYDDFNERSYYSPTGSLYKAYRVEIDKNGDPYINADNASFIESEHRVSNEYIYEYMFSEGWHGGANFNGVMKIPVGLPAREYNGTSTPWNVPTNSIPHKWINAYKSNSPKNEMLENVDRYYEDEAQEDVNDAFDDWRKENEI